MMKPTRNRWIALAAVAIAFGVGSGWQLTKARQARTERDAALQRLADVQQQRALEQLEASLAMATVAAQFGDFERGRQLASAFFAMLQEQVRTAPQTSRSALSEILARRDGIITVLSRAQPESGLELAALLTWLQTALGKEPTVPSGAGRE